MGMVSTEQTVEIIEAVSKAQPEVQEPNYWWLLLIGVIPVILTFILRGRK